MSIKRRPTLVRRQQPAAAARNLPKDLYEEISLDFDKAALYRYSSEELLEKAKELKPYTDPVAESNPLVNEVSVLTSNIYSDGEDLKDRHRFETVEMAIQGFMVNPTEETVSNMIDGLGCRNRLLRYLPHSEKKELERTLLLLRLAMPKDSEGFKAELEYYFAYTLGYPIYKGLMDSVPAIEYVPLRVNKGYYNLDGGFSQRDKALEELLFLSDMESTLGNDLCNLEDLLLNHESPELSRQVSYAYGFYQAHEGRVNKLLELTRVVRVCIEFYSRELRNGNEEPSIKGYLYDLVELFLAVTEPGLSEEELNGNIESCILDVFPNLL